LSATLDDRRGRLQSTREREVEIAPTILSELARAALDSVRAHEPMARHTSFGLGGAADVYVAPAGGPAFKQCLRILSSEGVPVFVLGKGTNVLVRDGGIDGAVVATERAFTDLVRTDEGLFAGSGVTLARTLSFCVEEGLSGIEELAGIPGTVGGGVVTNAGSFGVALTDRLSSVTVFHDDEPPVAIPREDLAATYRRTDLPAGVVVESVTLRLERDRSERVRERQSATLERKWKAQPAGMRSAGCVFKNPPGNSAGRLIDETGLKGTRVGGAVVSDLHANYILNDRGASAEDVEELIDVVRSRVAEATGVALELEIEIVGRRAG
jgi:UDP-N-acetylmuramate dehydrogenase